MHTSCVQMFQMCTRNTGIHSGLAREGYIQDYTQVVNTAFDYNIYESTPNVILRYFLLIKISFY
jgi:hypothetical protein